MRPLRFAFATAALLSAVLSLHAADGVHAVKETSLDAPHGLSIKVRMEGPYDADVPLQIVCYFKHKEAGDKTLGAAVELDKRLQGVIASLRNRGEFRGDELETLLLVPRGAIKPQSLLLIGLGDEETLSLERLERVGATALREAARLGVSRVAFAPLIRDQGNGKFSAGDVERSIVRGVLLAYDTERRLQQEKVGRDFMLETWCVEAGPDYFDDTVSGVKTAIADAREKIAARGEKPYRVAP